MAEQHHREGDLRDALVDAGIDLVRQQGITALSLRAVARRAGVSHAAPAHHVGDRAGLIAAIVERSQALLAERIARAGATASGSASVLAGMRAYVDFASEEPALFALMFRPDQWRDDAGVRAAHAAGLASTRDAVVTAQSQGWAPDADPDVLAVAVWSLSHGVAMLNAAGAIELAPEVTLDAMFGLWGATGGAR